MHISVRLAEPFWRAVGERELYIELGDGSCIRDLLQFLQENYPSLKREIEDSPPMIFIGDLETNLQTVLEEGVQVHLVWPIAGGSCDL